MTASSSMYLDSSLRIEIISSLLGQTIKPYDKKSRGTAEDILSVDEFHLHNLTGKRQAYVKQPIIKEEDFFDPDYDCDFTNLSDTKADCKRGDELYERPKGWYRMALKVKGKYPDGDTWLGTKGWRNHSVPGEWPVSYHGTSLKGAKGIIKSHYSAGDRDLYGRGIYSTPDIHVAEREEYAKTFTSKTTGKSYKVILQNRINPKMREICQRFDYWLVPVRKGASAEEERQIVDSSIRPYGILIKELNDDDSDEVYGDGSGQEDGYEVGDDCYSDSYDRHDDGSMSDNGDEDDDTGDGDDDDDGDEDDDTDDGDDDGDDTGDGDDDGDDTGDGDDDGDEDDDTGDDGDDIGDDDGDEDDDVGDGDEDASYYDDGDGGDGNESEDDDTIQDNSDDNDGGDDDGDGDEDFDDDGSYNDGRHDTDYSEDTCNDDGDNDDDVSGSYDDDDDDWS